MGIGTNQLATALEIKNSIPNPSSVIYPDNKCVPHNRLAEFYVVPSGYSPAEPSRLVTWSFISSKIFGWSTISLSFTSSHGNRSFTASSLNLESNVWSDSVSAAYSNYNQIGFIEGGDLYPGGNDSIFPITMSGTISNSSTSLVTLTAIYCRGTSIWSNSSGTEIWASSLNIGYGTSTPQPLVLIFKRTTTNPVIPSTVTKYTGVAISMFRM